jgi:hypothetical protein
MMRSRSILAAALLLAMPLAASAQDETVRPNLEGFWNLPFAQTPAVPEDLKAKLPPDTVVLDDTGVYEFPKGEFGGLKLKPETLEKAENWDPSDEMTLTRVCHPPAVVYAMQGPFPFEIHQTDKLIVIRYEYFDQTRLVFMDGRGHPPEDAPHSAMGHSIGHWEGDDLVIETTHIAASTITNNGLDHSENIRMVERYRLREDGQKLYAIQWFEDPETLDNAGARYLEWNKYEGQYLNPYECDPSFALEYQEIDGKN